MTEPLDAYHRAARDALLMAGTSGSLPLLVREAGVVRLAFVVYPIVVRMPEGKLAYPPTHFAVCDLETGELLELRHQPMKASGPLGPRGALGAERMPEGYDFHSFIEARDRLARHLFELAPHLGSARPGRTVREAAVEARRLYGELCDPLLAPFLPRAAPELFAWLETTR